MQIKRKLENQIIDELKKQSHQVVVLYGARRVGKTVLMKKIVSQLHQPTKILLCDDPDIQRQLSGIGLTALKKIVGANILMVLDEAQRVGNIGSVLKLLADYVPGTRVLVTGSSSLDLANTITEPLTGRKKTFLLYPVAYNEITKNEEQPSESQVDEWLRYGMYPAVLSLNDEGEKQDYLRELTRDYLYKDTLHFLGEKNSEAVRKLLIALALQIGQEVSYTELGMTVGMDPKTVVKYIELLEQSFILVRLIAFARNLRTELKKTRKIYFYDVGIRNAILDNFGVFEKRNDLGQVWENWIIMERMKRDGYIREHKNYYFWRTHEQKEVDLIEEKDGGLTAIEIKWQTKGESKHQREFGKIYPGTKLAVVDRGNFDEFLK
ncbi:MAG: ATP-binding protein [bacterium]